MKDFIKALQEALERRERAVLCTIVAAEGSSPRSAGAKMAVFADGSIAGSIGGGAVEFAAITLAKELMEKGESSLRRFALHPSEQDQLNMICGGEVTVFFALLQPEVGEVQLARWRDMVEGQRTHYLRFSVQDESAFCVLEPSQLLHETAGWDGTTYLEKAENTKRVLLFGGGHVGRALVPALHAVGFRVWVIDAREDVAREEYFPAAERVLQADFSAVSKTVDLGAEDYVVVMTSGHQADYEVLRQILPHEVKYIGCIGSRRKAAAVRERLEAAGFSAEQIGRICSPIGLAIGAQTPEEIAVSIAAEMIACRAGFVKE